MLELVQKAIDALDTEDFSLSKVIHRVLNLAEMRGDAFNFIVLKTIGTNTNLKWEPEELYRVRDIAAKSGITGEGFTILKEKAVSKAIAVKTVDVIYDVSTKKVLENQVLAYSAGEVERQIKILSERIKENRGTTGLFNAVDTGHHEAYSMTYTKMKDYVRWFLVDYEMELLSRETNKGGNEKVVENNNNNNNNNVFIIHGHNEARWRELSTLLKEEFSLNPVVLSEKESSGLTIIEKFEKYAKDCSFAFALITSDDTVVKNDVSYLQARPNVIFELGWFHGQIGRDRVCILVEEGASIPSDLDGIMQLRFRNSLDEVFRSLQRELRAANLV